MKTDTGQINQEPIWKLLGKMCIQATFSLFVYSAYSFTDTWVVAKWAGVMRAAGHLKYATLQWIVPITVNLGFDILLVCGLGMGVRGAAWATILSQIVSSITSLYYFLIYKKKTYLITSKSICIDKSIMSEIAAVGCPSLFQQMGNSIAAIVFQTLVISAGSGIVYAAYVIVNQIMQIFWTPHTGIAQGAQPLIGYFCGSGDIGKKERVIHDAVLISVLCGIGSMVICTGIFESAFFLFTDETLLLRYGKEIFGFLIFIFPIKGVGTILLTVLQTEGKTRKAWFLSLISICAIQLPCLFWGKCLWGVKGLWIAMIAAECIYVICAVVLVRREKMHGKYNKEQET